MSPAISKDARKDTIVAVRMPHGLVDELRELQKVNHFMDLSDEIRFVVRKYLVLAKKDEHDVVGQKKKEKLIEELSALLDSLKQEGT